MADEASAIALAEVRAYCGWRIAPSTRETFVVDGEDAGCLLLPTMNLTDVHTITADGTDVDLTTVRWSRSGVIRYGYGPGGYPFPYSFNATSTYWPCWRSVSVEVTHGYETMPLDVQAVVDRLAARTTSNPGLLVQVGQVRTAVGADGLPIGGTLTGADFMVLDRYRLPPRP